MQVAQASHLRTAAPSVPTTKPSEKHKLGLQNYTADEDLKILQTALDLKFFEANHGDENKEKEFGDAVRRLKIPGTNRDLKARFLQILRAYQEARFADSVNICTLLTSFSVPPAYRPLHARP